MPKAFKNVPEKAYVFESENVVLLLLLLNKYPCE